MSQSFSKLIKTSGRLYEFNFRRIPGKDLKYHVDVPDARGNRIIFHVSKGENDEWVTTDQIPEWVKNAFSDIADVLQQQEQDRDRSFQRKKI